MRWPSPFCTHSSYTKSCWLTAHDFLVSQLIHLLQLHILIKKSNTHKYTYDHLDTLEYYVLQFSNVKFAAKFVQDFWCWQVLESHLTQSKQKHITYYVLEFVPMMNGKVLRPPFDASWLESKKGSFIFSISYELLSISLNSQVCYFSLFYYIYNHKCICICSTPLYNSTVLNFL